jgi:hypothetical protein
MKSYTTRLLADLHDEPSLRYLAGGAVAVIVVCSIALAYLWQGPAEPASAQRIIVLATATPRPAPTATPAPAPKVVEMSDHSIVAYEPARGWYILREAPTQPAAVVVEQAPVALPVQQVIYDAPAPEQAPAPEVETVAATAEPAPEAIANTWQGVPYVADPCTTWHAPAPYPAGCQ